MPITARSARGEIVDFDILQIKQQLAATPVQVGTEERRRFIDTKDGVKPKTVIASEIPTGLKDISAMSMATDFVVEEEPVEEVIVDIPAKKAK